MVKTRVQKRKPAQLPNFTEKHYYPAFKRYEKEVKKFISWFQMFIFKHIPSATVFFKDPCRKWHKTNRFYFEFLFKIETETYVLEVHDDGYMQVKNCFSGNSETGFYCYRVQFKKSLKEFCEKVKGEL